jgi:hypothetical protein
MTIDSIHDRDGMSRRPERGNRCELRTKHIGHNGLFLHTGARMQRNVARSAAARYGVDAAVHDDPAD